MDGYKTGDILTHKDALTGSTREYQILKVNRKTVIFKCVKIGEVEVSGEVRRGKPDENGDLWLKYCGKLCRV